MNAKIHVQACSYRIIQDSQKLATIQMSSISALVKQCLVLPYTGLL